MKHKRCYGAKEEKNNGMMPTVPPTVGSGVWRKLVKLPEIPPSMYIKKNVNGP